MKMKKIIWFTLLLSTSFLLASCWTQKNNNSNNTTQVKKEQIWKMTPKQIEEKYKVKLKKWTKYYNANFTDIRKNYKDKLPHTYNYVAPYLFKLSNGFFKQWWQNLIVRIKDMEYKLYFDRNGKVTKVERWYLVKKDDKQFKRDLQFFKRNNDSVIRYEILKALKNKNKKKLEEIKSRIWKRMYEDIIKEFKDNKENLDKIEASLKRQIEEMIKDLKYDMIFKADDDIKGGDFIKVLEQLEKDYNKNVKKMEKNNTKK